MVKMWVSVQDHFIYNKFFKKKKQLSSIEDNMNQNKWEVRVIFKKITFQMVNICVKDTCLSCGNASPGWLTENNTVYIIRNQMPIYIPKWTVHT